jgi:hypothetical protein
MMILVRVGNGRVGTAESAKFSHGAVPHVEQIDLVVAGY